ncbi:hypothetical protein BKA70DRAFT_1219147 [Coprinopsis sp. MPI-PUGE-AT-0042]|nr:hypothetical protein BKA70DRAFT_1219147 [Coprinopsis sp. MPI-PUGE-AT-0042]
MSQSSSLNPSPSAGHASSTLPASRSKKHKAATTLKLAEDIVSSQLIARGSSADQSNLSHPSVRARSRRPTPGHSKKPRIVPLTEMSRYSPQELLQLSQQANELHQCFTSAALSLEQAYRRYQTASQLWDRAGAPLALTLQTHLDQFSLPDEARNQLHDILHPLDLSHVSNTQQTIAHWGYTLAQEQLGVGPFLVV